MSAVPPARVGLVGCGVISGQYAPNAAAFDSFEIVACADRDEGAARTLATEHGYAVATVEELLADPAIDVVLNLTPPDVHGDVIRAALAAGKHVYTEKPLATTVAEAAALVAEADRRGLALGCAPDVFLAAPYREARRLLDGGAIGEPLAVAAAMLIGGHTTWHPSPEQFYADGAGPLLDMGPYYLTAIVALLGPIRRVTGFASIRTAERTVELGPRAGRRFRATTPTHTASTLELDGGVTVNLTAGFEVVDQYVCDLVVYGTEARLTLPDPNGFVGPILLRRGRRPGWDELPLPARAPRDGRGVGLDDLVRAVRAGREPRASGRLALHVVEVARAVLESAASGRAVEIRHLVERPPAPPDHP